MNEFIFCVGIFVAFVLISWIYNAILRNKSLNEPNGDKNYQWHEAKMLLFNSFADKAYYVEVKLQQAKSLPSPQKIKLLAVCEDLVSELNHVQGKTNGEIKYMKELDQKTFKANQKAFHEGKF